VKYIFKDGVLSDISGFKSVNGTVTIADHIVFTTNSNAYSHWYSNELVDVTNYREIKVTIPDDDTSRSFRSGNTPLFGVSKNVPSNSSGAIGGLEKHTTFENKHDGKSIVKGDTYTVDVSAVDGAVYLVFSASGTQSWKGVLHISKIEFVT